MVLEEAARLDQMIERLLAFSRPLLLQMTAIDASAAGGRVRVTIAADRQDVVIVVHDEGSGIPASAMAHVFDPFFTTKPQGTGLGLSIAHEIVRAHAGDLTIANDPNGGAIVTIRLPVSGPSDHGAPPGLTIVEIEA